GAAAAQVEQRAMARALDRARLRVERTFREGSVVVRAAILDRVKLAAGVEHADPAAVHVEQARIAGLKLGSGADFDSGRADHVAVVDKPELEKLFGILSLAVGFRENSHRLRRNLSLVPLPTVASSHLSVFPSHSDLGAEPCDVLCGRLVVRGARRPLI